MEKIFEITYEHSNESEMSRSTDYSVGMTEFIAVDRFMKGKDPDKIHFVSAIELKIKGYQISARPDKTLSDRNAPESIPGEETIDTAVINDDPDVKRLLISEKYPNARELVMHFRGQADRGELLQCNTDGAVREKMTQITEVYSAAISQGYWMDHNDLRITGLAAILRPGRTTLD